MHSSSDHGYNVPTACGVCRSYEFPCLCLPHPKFPVVCDDAVAGNGEHYTLGMARTETGARRVLQRWLRSRRKAGHMVRCKLARRGGPTAWVEM